MPWHIYRALPAIDRAEIVAHYREHGIRDGHRAQKLKAEDRGGGHAAARDDYLG